MRGSFLYRLTVGLPLLTSSILCPALNTRSLHPPPPPCSAVPRSHPVPKPYAKQTKVDPPAPSKESAPAKKAAAALPVLDKRLPPLEAPTVSCINPDKCPSQRQGKHTVHSPLRHSIIITPPSKMLLRATKFHPKFVNKLNTLLESDLKVLDLLIKTAFDLGPSVFLDTTWVPAKAETAFILKHTKSL
jgi:hypothetical protein